MRRDAVDHFPQRRQIGRAIVRRGRSNGQINDLGFLDGRGRIGRKLQTLGFEIASTNSASPGS